MERKSPRSNRDRILELALRLFNDHGEPNVSTGTLAEALGISPGNLYYHFRNKDDIVNSLFGEFERDLESTLSEVAARDATIAGARDFLAALFGLFWRYRFLYRDINELLSRNRRLETRFKRIVERETALMHIWLQDLARNGDLLAPADRLEALATNMIVVSSFWLSFEFVRDARSFGSGRHIAASTQRGMRQTLALLDPWLAEPARAELAHTLADLPADTAGRPRAPDWQDIRQPQPGVAWSPPLAVRTTALRAARATASDSSHITDAAAPRAADADAATADAAETTAGTQPPTPTDGQ